MTRGWPWRLLFLVFLFPTACSDDSTEPKPTSLPFGETVTLEAAVTWDPTSGTFSHSDTKADNPAATAMLEDTDIGVRLTLLEAQVLDQVARLKTQLANLASPVTLMSGVTTELISVSGQEGVQNDGPWSYGDLDNGQSSDAVQWRLTNLDPTAAFTLTFKISWTLNQSNPGPAEYIVTGDYGNKYYLVDPETKTEVASIDPLEPAQDVREVSVGYLSRRLFFTSKPQGVSHHQLFACDLITGENVQQLTQFDNNGLANPDGNPRNDSVVFEAAEEGGITSIYVIHQEGQDPVRLTYDTDTLVVPGADDPTVSWGDHYPAWSPDGQLIAYVRHSKDTEGPNIPMLDTVVVMSADGRNPQVLYAEEGEGTHDVCWTHDGDFVLFTRGQENDHSKRVIAVHVATGQVSDLTDGFSGGEPGVPASLWCSPSQNAVVMAPVVVNPDLYRVQLTVNGSSMSVGTMDKITDQAHYRKPDWATAVKDFSQDLIGTYGDTLPAQAIVSADYGNKYYVVDGNSGAEVLSVNPGVPGVNHVTMSHDGQRVYFLAKEAGASGPDLYGCDTLTGENLTKLTRFNTMGLGQPDASPVDSSILLQALEGGGTPHIYLLSEETATPIRLTGDETLEVPGADDPTVTWGDSFPAWSPDGQKIAYARASKDTEGANLGSFGTVVQMNKDGSDKRVLYAEPGVPLQSVCWTHDGEFVVFSSGQAYDHNRKVLAVHVGSGTVSDLTTGFTGAAGVPAHHWCSPSESKLVYAGITVNPDFYLAELTVSGEQLSVGNVSQLTHGQHYRWPDWVAVAAN